MTEENNDSIEEENENMEENIEEPSDIDQSEELSEDEQYQQELDKYFEELEAKYGIDYANKVREKITGAKQLEHFLDLNKWSLELAQMEMEALNQAKKQNELLFKQTGELLQKHLELMDENDNRSKNFFVKALKSIDDGDKRDEELSLLVKQLAIKIDARSKERHDLKMQLLKEGKTGD